MKTRSLVIKEITIHAHVYAKREFVPRDQIFPLIAVYCFLLVLKNKWFNASFIR